MQRKIRWTRTRAPLPRHELAPRSGTPQSDARARAWALRATRLRPLEASQGDALAPRPRASAPRGISPCGAGRSRPRCDVEVRRGLEHAARAGHPEAPHLRQACRAERAGASIPPSRWHDAACRDTGARVRSHILGPCGLRPERGGRADIWPEFASQSSDFDEREVALSARILLCVLGLLLARPSLPGSPPPRQAGDRQNQLIHTTRRRERRFRWGGFGRHFRAPQLHACCRPGGGGGGRRLPAHSI